MRNYAFDSKFSIHSNHKGLENNDVIGGNADCNDEKISSKILLFYYTMCRYIL
jgi:hypothetical protein